MCDAAGDVEHRDGDAGSGPGDPGWAGGGPHLGAVARKESETSSRRLRRKHASWRRGVVAGGGTRPYGYADDRLTMRPEEAAVVREAAARMIAGESLRSVCVDLDERGVAPRRAVDPSDVGAPAALGPYLGTPGASRAGGGHAVWPAIISRPHSDRLRGLLGRRRTRPFGPGPPPLPAHRRPAQMRPVRHPDGVPAPPSDGTRRYVCAQGPGFGGCGRMATIAEPVEALVAEAVLQRLDTPELAAALADARQADAEADRTPHRAGRRRGPAGRAGRRTTPPTPSATGSGWPPVSPSRPASTRPAAACPASPRPTGSTSTPAAPTCCGTPGPTCRCTRQHAIIRLILDHVVVHPAVKGRNTFDLTRFQPVWRL